MQKVGNPFLPYLDARGQLADGGKIYVGDVGADPETSPILTYWDSALTIPAAQPLRTLGGYVVNGATPAFFYIAENDYSMRIRDSEDTQVAYSPSNFVSGITYQPLDATLTALAALTIGAYGLALLESAAPTEGHAIDLTLDGDGVVTAIAVVDTAIKAYEFLTVAVTGETVALAAGTAKVKFRAPYALTLAAPGGLAIRASLSTPQTSGALVTIDINETGGSILSTKLTIDNGESTSTTATTPAVISDANIADDAEISIDIDGIGDGTAEGLKLTFIWHRT